MSTPEVDIRALARLARLAIADSEVSALQQELPAIVAFVDTLQKVAVHIPAVSDPEVRNVMREDTNPHTPGTYTERLLAGAPAREGDYVVVKQVLKK